jgi:4-hydroxybenzoate polyprenyltransferase
VITDRRLAAAFRRSGLALLTVSLQALVMVGVAIPLRWWAGGLAFTGIALVTAWCAGGELRSAHEHTEQADWLEARR